MDKNNTHLYAAYKRLNLDVRIYTQAESEGVKKGIPCQ